MVINARIFPFIWENFFFFTVKGTMQKLKKKTCRYTDTFFKND